MGHRPVGQLGADGSTVLFWSFIFFPLLVTSVCVIVAQVYAQITIQWRWRAWLNNQVLDRWLTNGRYYQLNLVGGDHTNPEYRIADDIRAATEAPIDFVTGVTTAVLSAATFIVVLWTIGGSLNRRGKPKPAPEDTTDRKSVQQSR